MSEEEAAFHWFMTHMFPRASAEFLLMIYDIMKAHETYPKDGEPPQRVEVSRGH